MAAKKPPRKPPQNVSRKASRKATKTPKQRSRKPANQPPREPGRPSSFTEEIGKAICGWLVLGYSLREIEQQSGMPAKSTILRWLSEYESFRDQYARAREVQAWAMEDEILEIADDNRNDWVERVNAKSGETTIALNDEAIQRSRARIDARKWLMGKMAPKRYGERVKIGNDPENPLPAPAIGVIVVPAKGSMAVEDDGSSGGG